MRSIVLPLLLACGGAIASPANPLIDYDAFVRDVGKVRALRESRRLDEAQFIRMASEPGTVVLDARSERLYRLRHVKGAVNLSFPEFTAETLAYLIPSRVSLHTYGYRNVYELGPAVDPKESRLAFEGEEIR